MFDNGFGISIIGYGGGIESEIEELALAVITEDGLHYNNSVARGDIRNNLTREEVTELAKEVESFEQYDPTDKEKHYGN